EGVIPYLTNSDAEILSKDLFSMPTFQYWIQDYRQGGLKQAAPRRMRKMMKTISFKFDMPDWLSFFSQNGWVIRENLLAMSIAEEFKRPLPFMFPWTFLLWLTPQKAQKKWRQASGYVMYGKP